MESMLYRKKWPLIIFITPAFFFLVVFLFYPFVMNIVNSFFQMTELSEPLVMSQLTLDNYKMLATDTDLHIALVNTLKMMVMAVVFQVGVALVLAILVDRARHAQQLFRTIYFFPIVISSTAIGLIFTLLYVPSGGLDQLLLLFGIQNEQLWLDEGIAFYMISLPVLWQYVGFYFIIIITGLSGISEEVFEAAEIDGASAFQQVRFITLPLLFNVISTCVMLSVTGSLKVFDLFWTMLPNGINGTFLTGTYMYYVTYQKHQVSYAAVVALLIVVLGVAAAQLCNRLLKPKEY